LTPLKRLPQLLVLLLSWQIWQLFQKNRSFFKFKFNGLLKPCNIFIFGTKQSQWSVFTCEWTLRLKT